VTSHPPRLTAFTGNSAFDLPMEKEKTEKKVSKLRSHILRFTQLVMFLDVSV